MDLQSRARWITYSRAMDELFKHTGIKQAPRYVVNVDVKKHARLNCVSHPLSMIPTKDLTLESIDLPPWEDEISYVRPL